MTGHDHIDSVGLIHMNGRAYDPELGRFLSVDPFIQFPLSSQSLNPYSYVMNNPIMGTDPTGYLAFLLPLVPVIIESLAGGAALYAAYEGGRTVGTAARDIATGERTASEVAETASRELATEAIMTATGTKALRVAEKFVPPSIKNKIDDVAESLLGKKGNNGEDSSIQSDGDTTKIGSQEKVKSTSELRGKGNFKEGAEAADKRSPNKCEYCGKETEKIEGDHFESLNDGKKAVNEGRMTKTEAIEKYDSKENYVNSCTDCNRGPGGKHSKTPSSTAGEGKFEIDKEKASEYVKQKLDDLETR